MAKKKESTAEQKLRALYNLQIIDSRIDKIRQVHGELPLEVQDLEDELEGMNLRLSKVEEEISDLNLQINEKKNVIEESKAGVAKYVEQQKKVRNNREYDSLTKEIEYQGLEVELAEKRINEYKARIASKKELLETSISELEDKKGALDAKKNDLAEIEAETAKEESLLREKSKEASAGVEERLLKAYTRIRNAAKNGLAVVPVERGASGGSYIKIPPQRQLDIAARKKIIIDEHSGRILVDLELANEETVKMEKMLAKLLK
jgi:predicted  nucleic acid-binding Zn-ribbon protein